MAFGAYKLYWWREFKKNKPDKRLSYVNSNKLCIVCFSNDHVSIKCDRDITCKICQRKHSTYVHVNKHVNGIILVMTMLVTLRLITHYLLI